MNNKYGDLIIPVYLNQRVVFDLVAMLRGGIATVTRVVDSADDSTVKDKEVGGTFGLNKALSSLLRVDLSGRASSSKTEGEQHVQSEERVHTPASLFFEARKLIEDKKLLQHDTAELKPKAGDFIEFQAILERNPIIETMDASVEVVELANLFTDQKKSKKSETDGRKLAAQMRAFSEKLRAGDTLDLITPPLECSYRCVVTLEIQYLNDPHLSDLVDGTFRVLGKIIRVVDEEGGAISLIRKTAVGRMPEEMLRSAFSGFQALSEEQGYALPELRWKISGPVLLVIPIAIYT